MAPVKEWYGLYNVIFNWFKNKYGDDQLENYWRHIAESCYNEIIQRFKETGLEGIKEYFEGMFNKDNGEYVSKLDMDKLTFEVTKCPDYDYMNSSDNPHFIPISNYCDHHRIMNAIIAEKSGFEFKMLECGNNGKCKWLFKKRLER